MSFKDVLVVARETTVMASFVDVLRGPLMNLRDSDSTRITDRLSRINVNVWTINITFFRSLAGTNQMICEPALVTKMSPDRGT